MTRWLHSVWLLALILGCALVLSSPMWSRWLSGSHFAVQQVQLQAPFRQVTEQQIGALLAPELKPGLFLLDLQQVRTRLLQNPWIENVEVRKLWPHALAVTVRERTAEARWGDAGLLSSAGEYFKVPGAAAMTSLPQLSGPTSKRMEVLGFYRKADASLRGLSLHMTRAHFSSRGGLQAELSNGARVLIGRSDIDNRWERFVQALPTFISSSNSARTLKLVDLRYTNGMAITFNDASAPPASAPNIESPSPHPSDAEPEAPAARGPALAQQWESNHEQN
jgi:cell division protein FtsQ